MVLASSLRGFAAGPCKASGDNAVIVPQAVMRFRSFIRHWSAISSGVISKLGRTVRINISP